MNIQWDGEKYASDFSYVHQYGESVTALLETPKGGAVLDLGCGTGALTGVLRDMGYAVRGMDADREQLAVAKRTRPDIEFFQADAADFSLERPVDAVFSNAVLHWIDQERQPDMLRCVRRALKDRGEFVFEFGGRGNVRRITEAAERVLARHGYGCRTPFYFPSVGEYGALLEREGFSVRYAVLFDRPTALKGENGLRDWMAMFFKTPLSAVEDAAEREAVMNETAEEVRSVLFRNGSWYADYVRLRMRCVCR